jgi:hypothetical protein
MLNEKELITDNGEIIDFCFTQYRNTSNILYINKVLKIINAYANQNFDAAIQSEDLDKSIKLYIMARYALELFSFYINTMNNEQLKEILKSTELLDNVNKTYITNTAYSKIKEGTVKCLKKQFSQNKRLNEKIFYKYINKNSLRLWGSESEIKAHEMEDYKKKKYKGQKKHRSSLQVISLTNNEIEMVKKIFTTLTLKTSIVKINNIITIDNNEYIIDPDTSFNFKFEWADNDPYAFYITRAIYMNKNNSATMRYGWRGGAFDGRGFVAEFEKKDDYWEKRNEILEWVS